MIKNASGVVRKKVDEVYGERLPEEEKRALCALIYYPDERIEYERTVQKDLTQWYKKRLSQVVEIARGDHQIQPFQGAEDSAARLCVYHQGIVA